MKQKIEQVVRGMALIAVVLSFCFLGCGEKSEDGKTVIRFSNAETLPEQIAIMKEIVKEFEAENPDIRVKLEWGTTPEKILAQIAGGSPPDVYMWWEGISVFKEKNVLLPLNEYIKKYNIDLSKYFKALVDFYTFDGELYAFPLQMKTACLIYNKKIFDKAGMPYPDVDWTWDDYYETAKKLTGDFNNDGIKDQFGTQSPWASHWVQVNGGGIVDVEKNKCIAGEKESMEALEFLVKLYNDACPSRAEGAAFAGVQGASSQLSSSGRVAMGISWAFMLPAFNKIKNFEWDVAPVPKPSNRKIVHVFDDACLCLAAGSKHPEEAFRFIKFYCGEKGMMIFGKGKNGMPAYKDAAYKVFLTPPPEHLEYYVDAAEKATVSHAFKNSKNNHIFDIWRTKIEQKVFLVKPATVETLEKCMKEVVPVIDKILAE